MWIHPIRANPEKDDDLPGTIAISPFDSESINLLAPLHHGVRIDEEYGKALGEVERERSDRSVRAGGLFHLGIGPNSPVNENRGLSAVQVKSFLSNGEVRPLFARLSVRSWPQMPW